MTTDQLIAWHHFKFRVPSDWEVTSYSEEDRAGRLEFSTRKGFQATVSWEPCKREPDRETTMLSFLRTAVPGVEPSQIKSKGDLDIRPIDAFLVGYHSDETPCQALMYLEEQKKLIRWAFTPSRKSDLDDVWLPILKSFEQNNGDVRETAIFGLDFFLPEAFALEDMKVAAAKVMLGYESRKTKSRATFRRLGLPVALLRGASLDRFYRAFLSSNKCIVTGCRKTTLSGMAAARASYKKRGEFQMDKFMGRLWQNGEAWLWHNEEEKRLYSFEQIGPRKRPLLKFEDVFPYLERDETDRSRN